LSSLIFQYQAPFPCHFKESNLSFIFLKVHCQNENGGQLADQFLVHSQSVLLHLSSYLRQFKMILSDMGILSIIYSTFADYGGRTTIGGLCNAGNANSQFRRSMSQFKPKIVQSVSRILINDAK